MEAYREAGIHALHDWQVECLSMDGVLEGGVCSSSVNCAHSVQRGWARDACLCYARGPLHEQKSGDYPMHVAPCGNSRASYRARAHQTQPHHTPLQYRQESRVLRPNQRRQSYGMYCISHSVFMFQKPNRTLVTLLEVCSRFDRQISHYVTMFKNQFTIVCLWYVLQTDPLHLSALCYPRVVGGGDSDGAMCIAAAQEMLVCCAVRGVGRRKEPGPAHRVLARGGPSGLRYRQCPGMKVGLIYF